MAKRCVTEYFTLGVFLFGSGCMALSQQKFIDFPVRVTLYVVSGLMFTSLLIRTLDHNDLLGGRLNLFCNKENLHADSKDTERSPLLLN